MLFASMVDKNKDESGDMKKRPVKYRQTALTYWAYWLILQAQLVEVATASDCDYKILNCFLCLQP